MLLFNMKMPNNEQLMNIHLETLIHAYTSYWQKAWVTSMQINEKMVKETDILEILFNIIERFCQILEDEEEIHISFDTYIDEPHDEYSIIDWNVVLHHVQIGKAYKERPY